MFPAPGCGEVPSQDVVQDAHRPRNRNRRNVTLPEDATVDRQRDPVPRFVLEDHLVDHAVHRNPGFVFVAYVSFYPADGVHYFGGRHGVGLNVLRKCGPNRMFARL